jgi:hypothetical protein
MAEACRSNLQNQLVQMLEPLCLNPDSSVKCVTTFALNRYFKIFATPTSKIIKIIAFKNRFCTQ